MHRFVRVAGLAVAFSTGLLGACDGGESGPGGGTTGQTTTPPRPSVPTTNDTAFGVVGVPNYLLAGDDLTPPTPSFTIRVTPPAAVEQLDLWLDDGDPIAMSQDGADWVVTVDALPLAVGDHSVMLAERDAESGFYFSGFKKGHALYMVVSTDWDFSDVDDRVLDHHEELHTTHPELKITHLIGPYTFTDSAVPQARRDLIVEWAKGMRDVHGDEIGLHVHPRCTFVEAAGLPCLTTPSVAYPEGDTTGYTVRLGAYSRDQWNVMFSKAADIWQSVGFGKATAFRAGAWTLETHVAQALFDSGFVVDSSPVNWPYLEEWEGYDLYSWNQAQWAPIGDTSQPYYPTTESVLPDGSGETVELLLLPDNGIMVDYWTVDEMTAIFTANWSGQALSAPVQVSTGFHPAPEQYYSKSEYIRLDKFFAHADQFLASQLAGPVVYIRMSDAVKVW
ncbi:MAG: hypothetical protein IPK82_36980 [Polyangiaceae bacterium]|nr:hypothetical protein [Polyangiaceae bacterium]